VRRFLLLAILPPRGPRKGSLLWLGLTTLTRILGVNTARLRSDTSLQLRRTGREETLNLIGFIVLIYCPWPDSFIVADIAVIRIRLIPVQHRSQQAGSRGSRGLLQLLRPDPCRQASLKPSMSNHSFFQLCRLHRRHFTTSSSYNTK
jgi:hypothetical protein